MSYNAQIETMHIENIHRAYLEWREAVGIWGANSSEANRLLKDYHDAIAEARKATKNPRIWQEMKCCALCGGVSARDVCSNCWRKALRPQPGWPWRHYKRSVANGGVRRARPGQRSSISSFRRKERSSI